MKILIGMSLLQTVALIVLIVMIGSGDANQTQQKIAGANSGEPLNQTAPLTDGAPPSVAEDRLRVIVREELALQSLAGTHQRASEVATPIDLHTAKKLADQRELVAQEIASLKGAGPVPDSQMQALLNEIEALDEQGRKQSMAMLARGINEGAIQGRL